MQGGFWLGLKVKTIDLAPEHLKTVWDILGKHLPKGSRVEVFGSRAKGTAKPYSDLDLALTCEGRLGRKILNRLEDDFEYSDLPFRVDLIDRQRAGEEFRRVIEKEGLPLPPQKKRGKSKDK